MRQSIIFILYLLCTFTARSQSALTQEQTGSIYYAILFLHPPILLPLLVMSLSTSVTTVVTVPAG